MTIKSKDLADYLQRRQSDLGLDDIEMARRCNMSAYFWKMFRNGEGCDLGEGEMAMTRKLAVGCGISTEQLLKNAKMQI